MSFWAGRRVFVTGHTGFKGAWLSLWLRRLGATVTGYALEPPSEPNLFTIARVGEDMDDVRGDVRDAARVAAALRSSRGEIVIHLAAQSLVRESYRAPLDTLATNVLGTAHVLEAVRHSPSVRAVIVVTSDKCYENREWPWPYRESDPVGGHDPYSASKGAAEIVAASYRRSFFSDPSGHRVSVATARAGNVIGGGDWGAEKLLPDIILSFTAGEALRLRSPTAVRPWQHVLDALKGYLLLAERLYQSGEFAEAWNFGPADADARPVAWIASRMCELWGADTSWAADTRAAPHEANLLRLDASKARSRLNWTPRLGLESALAWTVEWHRAHIAGNDMRVCSNAQIDRYEATA